MSGEAVIRDAVAPDDVERVRRLFTEYQAAIDVDLCFQGFTDELAALPGAYAPPRGRLLLALAGDEVAGCVAMRPLSSSECEMKRLYVRLAFRGGGVGRLLASALIAAARGVGYRRMCLDTLPTMAEAQALYRALGFREVEPYCYNPEPGALYFALEL